MLGEPTVQIFHQPLRAGGAELAEFFNGFDRQVVVHDLALKAWPLVFGQVVVDRVDQF